MSEQENSPYETGLDKNPANYVPLLPIGCTATGREKQ